MSKQPQDELEPINLEELSSFFDLLARFDLEDRKKANSVIDTDLLESAPKGSVPATETNQVLPLVEVKQVKQSPKHK